LTKKQAPVLAFIQARMPRAWRAPSYREIAAYQGLAVQPNSQHARRLERKGALPTARRHRNIRLSPEHGPPAGPPIIVGRVAAGTPILAVENLEGSLEIHRLIGERSNLFVLRLTGDSMMDPQIDEGDDVIVRAQPWIEPGDVGVVMIDEEDGQDDPAPAHWPVAEAREAAAGISADPAPTSAACTHRGQSDRHGDVARTAEAARADASTARGAAEATDGG
jgi:repressor LexA